jgi:nicotinate-nucleotide pyrophosphorylase (carboxylating)
LNTSKQDNAASSAAIQSRAAKPGVQGSSGPLPELDADLVDRLVDAALAEDLGSGDVTTGGTVAPETMAVGRLLARAPGRIAGLNVFARVFERVAPERSDFAIQFIARDGDRVVPNQVLAKLSGSAAQLLVGERTALNFMQRMSGIATMTSRFVEQAAGGARILDTRKTTPGLRALEKYSVLCGGGENHRFGLFDQAMIKDNHLDLSGMELDELIGALRQSRPELWITAEARDENEARAAARAGANVILLDNLSSAEIARICPILREIAGERNIEMEASGGIGLENVAEYARTGVDRISIGALTHSAPSLDLSFALEPMP